MEIYRAIADFIPPLGEGTENLLKFSKGDKFVVFDGQKERDWWGVRSLEHNIVGYVPSNYLRHDERKIGKLMPPSDCGGAEEKSEAAVEMQSAVDSRTPETYIGKEAPPTTPDPVLGQHVSAAVPSVPSPDYEEKTPPVSRKQSAAAEGHETELPEVPEPPPDYQDESDLLPPPPPDSAFPSPLPLDEPSIPPPPPPPMAVSAENGREEEGPPLIQAHRLPNPCLESKERMALHQELLFNHKRGKNVLQKPELDVALRKRKETQRIKEWESQKSLQRTSLELKLEERANRLKEEDLKMQPIPEKEEKTPEYLKIHKKITSKASTATGQ